VVAHVVLTRREVGQTAGMSEHEPRSAEEWDERYSGEQVWSGRPNQALVAEVSELSPGRALDVGCGEGADTVWLAQQGWQVTALDISPKAVQRTESAAARAGVAVEGVASGLVDASLADASYDLVSAMYFVLLRTPTREAERRLLDLVVPGGTLLVVHHADLDHDHDHESAFRLEDYVTPDDVRAAAVERGGWEVVADERRDREPVEGAGSHHHGDLVVRLRRTSR
jgi:SAM-dependent methyltransferase